MITEAKVTSFWITWKLLKKESGVCKICAYFRIGVIFQTVLTIAIGLMFDL